MSSRALRCVECGDPLPVPSSTGRPRRYCSAKCRYAARRRIRGAVIPAAVLVDPLPQDDPRARELLRNALAEDEPAAPEDRLAELLLELQAVTAELDRIAPALAPAVRVRVVALRRTIGNALELRFGEVIHV